MIDMAKMIEESKEKLTKSQNTLRILCLSETNARKETIHKDIEEISMNTLTKLKS
ncbi:hypothetical protein GvMRE_I1g563 [endosymbiont GvMRE of Glomus versiforme]|nr:hypothetical protein GvMRE_I1g563 [endosymbiont GvMRE of Glomus versiforme]